MLTWNLREAGVSAQLTHNSLAAGAITRRKGTTNKGCVVWTEILQSYSFSPVFLLTMWILHARLRYGKANTLIFLPSHHSLQEGSVMGSPGMRVWALSIWRRFQTQIIPFLDQCPNTIGLSQKNGMSTSSWQPSKGRSSSHLGSSAERQNIFSLDQKLKFRREWEDC